MIKLLDVLDIKKENYSSYKIHFATNESDKLLPLKLFETNKFEEDQSYQTKRNFQRPYIISLVYYDKDIWMYAGVFQVNAMKKLMNTEGKEYFHYDLTRTTIQEDLIGKLFIYYKKNFRASYPNLDMIPKNGDPLFEMGIYELRSSVHTIEDFPGFDKVNVSYQILKYIVDHNIRSWKNALSKAKGIYLIVDTHTGKQYVGSAYGDEAIWQRWLAYVYTGHGGNLELRKLIGEKGHEYTHNFKYSILEISNLNTSDIYIFERETYWKEVLQTRRFGLNSN